MEWQNGAGFDVDGSFVDVKSALICLASFEHGTGGFLIPLPFGKPYFYSGISIGLDGRCDGLDYHVVAEHVLVFLCVCFFGIGVVVIHRAAQGN